MAVDDATLMARLRDGEPEAFDALVERHRNWTVNMLWKMVGNRDDAEELAQEAFLRVYRARGRYRPEAQFRTWLRRIATNLALNHRRKKRPVRLADGEHASGNRRPDEVTAGAELVQHLWRALEALPARQRVALVLTRIEGGSYQEAAGAMNVSVEAVRSLIARARETLRARLEPVLSPGILEE